MHALAQRLFVKLNNSLGSAEGQFSINLFFAFHFGARKNQESHAMKSTTEKWRQQLCSMIHVIVGVLEVYSTISSSCKVCCVNLCDFDYNVIAPCQ